MEYKESKQKPTGFIPLSRKLFNHPFWKQKRVFSYAEAWIDLLQKARFDHAEGSCLIKNELITFRRGEFVVAHRLLSNNWGWSTWKLRRFLQILEEEAMISIRKSSATRTTIITICKYDEYNILQLADHPQTTHEQPNTNKEIKKEKKGEGNAHAQDEEFTNFICWMQHNTPNCMLKENFPTGITEKQYLKLRRYTQGRVAQRAHCTHRTYRHLPSGNKIRRSGRIRKPEHPKNKRSKNNLYPR